MQKMQEKANKLLTDIMKKHLLKESSDSKGEEHNANLEKQKDSTIVTRSPCTYCSKVFIDSKYLMKHIYRRHPEHLAALHERLITTNSDVNNASLKLLASLEKGFDEIKKELEILRHNISNQRLNTSKENEMQIRSEEAGNKTEEAINELKEILRHNISNQRLNTSKENEMQIGSEEAGNKNEEAINELKEIHKRCIHTEKVVQVLEDKLTKLYQNEISKLHEESQIQNTHLEERVLEKQNRMNRTLENRMMEKQLKMKEELQGNVVKVQKSLTNQIQDCNSQSSRQQQEFKHDIQRIDESIQTLFTNQNKEFSRQQQDFKQDIERLDKSIQNICEKLNAPDFFQEIQTRFEKQIEYFLDSRKRCKRKKKTSTHFYNSSDIPNAPQTPKSSGVGKHARKIAINNSPDEKVNSDSVRQGNHEAAIILVNEQLEKYNVSSKSGKLSNEEFGRKIKLLKTEMDKLASENTEFLQYRNYFDELADREAHKKMHKKPTRKVVFADQITVKANEMGDGFNVNSLQHISPVQRQGSSEFVVSGDQQERISAPDIVVQDPNDDRQNENLGHQANHLSIEATGLLISSQMGSHSSLETLSSWDGAE